MRFGELVQFVDLELRRLVWRLTTHHRSGAPLGHAYNGAVSRTLVDIRKIAPSGKREVHRFNPFWARFNVSRQAEIGITHMAVEGHGHEVAIGGFLNPDDRESFADAFGKALATAKTG